MPPSMFPTWPAKSEITRSKRREKSPKPPEGGINTFLVSLALKEAVSLKAFSVSCPAYREKTKNLQQLLS